MTNDFIEDACDVLDQCDAPYIILFGDGGSTKVVSNLESYHLPMLERWVDDGHINQIFRDHIRSMRNP